MYKWVRKFISDIFPPISRKYSWQETFEYHDGRTREQFKDSPYWQKITGEKEHEYKIRLLDVYKSRQFVRQGSAELLTPTNALILLDDLAAAGFVVKRVIGWYEVESPSTIHEYVDDLDYYFHLDPEYFYREHPVKESALIIKNYISQLPAHITHVYLEVFTPLMWEWEIFPEKWQTWDKEKKAAQGKK